MRTKTCNAVWAVDLNYAHPDGSIAFAGVSFSCRSGECLAVVGENGSGKSTLLRCIAGLGPVYSAGVLSGEVLVGESLDHARVLAHERGELAYVPQYPDRYFVASKVEGECAFTPCNLGWEVASIDTAIDAALVATGLETHRQCDIRTLSFGQRQRLAVAASLAGAPHILVLDEPTSNGDADSVVRLCRIISQLKASGVIVVLATHDPQLLGSVVDVLLLLDRDGRQCYFGALSNLGSEREAIRAIPIRRVPLWDIACESSENLNPFSVMSVAEALSMDPELHAKVPLRIPMPESTVLDGVSKGLPLVRLSNVRVSYGTERVVFENMGLSLYASEIVALMGPNGVGKTSLINVLSGLTVPGIGRVEFASTVTQQSSGGKGIPGRAMVFQEPAEQFSYAGTVLDEMLVVRGHPVALGSEVEEARSLLRVVGLEGRADLFPGNLSLGEQRRLLIARAMFQDAKLLFLDEPFAGLDGPAIDVVFVVLQRMVAAGACVVLTTHDSDLVYRYATRLIVLGRAGVIAEGRPRDVMALKDLRAHGIRPPTGMELGDLLAVRGVPYCLERES